MITVSCSAVHLVRYSYPRGATVVDSTVVVMGETGIPGLFSILLSMTSLFSLEKFSLKLELEPKEEIYKTYSTYHAPDATVSHLEQFSFSYSAPESLSPIFSRRMWRVWRISWLLYPKAFHIYQLDWREKHMMSLPGLHNKANMRDWRMKIEDRGRTIKLQGQGDHWFASSLIQH